MVIWAYKLWVRVQLYFKIKPSVLNLGFYIPIIFHPIELFCLAETTPDECPLDTLLGCLLRIFLQCLADKHHFIRDPAKHIEAMKQCMRKQSTFWNGCFCASTPRSTLWARTIAVQLLPRCSGYSDNITAVSHYLLYSNLLYVWGLS